MAQFSRSRRSILQWLASGGASFLMAACGESGSGSSAISPEAVHLITGEDRGVLPPVPPPERVIVIGAGIAGLTVARALFEADVDVVVLEARERLGGRIWTQPVAGVPMDLGATWLVGNRGNPLAAFAQANGLEYTADSLANYQIHDAFRGQLSATATARINRGFRQFVAQLDQLQGSLGPNASLQEGTDLFLQQNPAGPWESRANRFWIEQNIAELEWSAPAELLSLQNLPYGEGFLGGYYLPQGGYIEWVQAMAAGLDVQLETPVTEITWSHLGVRVSTGNQHWSGSHVIITIPLGVLKSGRPSFSPELPPWKQQAIHRLDMGNLEKVVLRFDQPFWRDPLQTKLDFYWLGRELGEFPWFTDPSDVSGAPVLVGYYGGGWSRDHNPKLTDAELIQRALTVLHQIIPEVPDPIDTAVTRWTTDPWTLGSYSYPRVGSRSQDSQKLAAPVAGRLLFAGEATAYPYTATVHGAMLSGLREANRLGIEEIGIPGLENYPVQLSSEID